MAGIFLGRSLDTSYEPVRPVDGFQAMTWTGWDGSEWDLLQEASGLFLSGAVRGLGMPEVEHYRSESPATAGSRWRGHRIPDREVFWPLFLFSDGGGDEWVQRDSAFWRTMHPDRTGVWTVVPPGGDARSLRLRFDSDGGHPYDFDPALRGWSLYTITLVAEDPYWVGEPITQEWSNVIPPTFFPGPPWALASSHTLAEAVLTNPGDVESWPVWTINGPFTAAAVGVAGQVVEVPFSMVEGETLVIDTDPRVQTAVTGAGVDRSHNLGAVGFAPVPARQFAPLSLSLTGEGSVSVSLRPRFYRAW